MCLLQCATLYFYEHRHSVANPLIKKVYLKKHLIVLIIFHGLVSTLKAQPDSLRLKIGQMLMIGLPGNVIDSNSRFYRDVRQGYVGGITMYERHLTQTNSAENLKHLIGAYQAASPVPLFVSITQEGGVVNRLKEKYGFPRMPSAAYFGKLDNTDSTKWYADNTAFTLSRLGININFAPVVDVYRTDNPVLGSRERTYSSQPDKIVKHAAQVIHSHNYFHVLTTLKHFPGHGSSATDTHLELTDVTATWTAAELAPYRALMQQGLVHSVMTAHIVNRKLDEAGLPATLSKKMISGLLRNQLGFRGLVFSDDMHMKAIAAEYELKEAITLAINAGVDVLLFSGNTEDLKSPAELVALIEQLVHSNKISLLRINESYRRIVHFKAQFARPFSPSATKF